HAPIARLEDTTLRRGPGSLVRGSRDCPARLPGQVEDLRRRGALVVTDRNVQDRRARPEISAMAGCEDGHELAEERGDHDLEGKAPHEAIECVELDAEQLPQHELPRIERRR